VAYDVDGVRHDEMPVDQTAFHHAKPIYEELPGWSEDISGVRSFEDLPAAARDYVLALEEMSGCRMSSIGVGPDREATIVRHDLLCCPPPRLSPQLRLTAACGDGDPQDLWATVPATWSGGGGDARARRHGHAGGEVVEHGALGLD